MAFTFEKYGTFAGPSTSVEFRDNDDFSLDPFEGLFNLSDVSMVLLNTATSPADYVYMHLAGSNTSTVTLERSTGPIPTFIVNADDTTFSGTVNADNFVGTWYGNSVGSVKSFDIPHPSKEGYRLRYICLEGPEAEVYLRGKLEKSNIIELPDYWKNLVDIETVGVTLTPIGVYQELFIEKIEWGQKIIVKNNLGGPINCSYVVYGQRKDVPRNITEYEGISAKDYPGEVVPYTP